MHTMKTFFKAISVFFCLSFLLFIRVSDAQVTVNINSGNPKFPFPQFLAYSSLGNLGTNNAPGVTHAEMEQRTRDAWQIFSNMFVYTGVTVSGVKYIKGNVGCPYDCSEGDGYAMLGAAYMADKTTFDGLWMRTHDLRMVKYPRYQDGITPNANYQYGQNTLVDGGGDAAADGDFDMALALLMAWKQWGDNMGINDSKGNPISYKTEALNVIRGLVEKNRYMPSNDCRVTSGDIGLDGYVKGGNTWGELTNWASNATPDCPEFKGPQTTYFDYSAPAYFHAFAQTLQAAGDPQWNIDQFLRAEASSDWLMGKMLDNATTLPLAGQVSLSATNVPTYSNFVDGEDFRNPWRTVLNYVWHGDPSTSWDPTNHAVIAGANSYEQNIGKRLAKFLANPSAAPWNNECTNVFGGPALTYKGPSQVKNQYNTLTGKELGYFPLNWLMGTGSPSAISAQDFDLMGKLFRQCVIEWDVTTSGDGYLTSVPRYFDGWFRLLGMMVLSGNAHSPLNMVPSANLKVYNTVDKTYGYVDDSFKYTVSYRNYGSVNATNTVIKLGVPTGFVVSSISNGGVLSGDSVVWNVGTVLGFKTGALAATTGSFYVLMQAKSVASGRYCTNAHITCSNGFGATSNEYPNNITTVMERNCIDIVSPSLRIDKSSDKATYSQSQDITFKLKFSSSASSGWLNGGRPGVNLSYAHDANPTSNTSIKFRLFHDASEAYIDYGNYRISYFLNDANFTCFNGQNSCTTGWNMMNIIMEGGDKTKATIFQENIAAGSDANGSWNQRIVLQFPPYVATTTQHLSRYYGSPSRVHQGGTSPSPLRTTWLLNAYNYASVNWTDDWSWNANTIDTDGGLYIPIGDDYTNPSNLATPVTTWHQSACTTSSQIMKKMLVEEWDGYVWRRVFGDGPILNTSIAYVTITDTLPSGLTFKNFQKQNALGINANTSALPNGKTLISWSIPSILVGQKDSIVYTATVGNICSGSDVQILSKARIQGGAVLPNYSNNSVTVSCTVTYTEDETRRSLLNVSVYPNPTKDAIFISGLDNKLGQVEIKDAEGRVCKNYVGALDASIDVAGLSNGIYVLEIIHNNVSKRTKLVIIK